MKFKVISNGYAHNVVAAKTGEKIEGIKFIEMKIEPNKPPVLIMECIDFEIEVNSKGFPK